MKSEKIELSFISVGLEMAPAGETLQNDTVAQIYTILRKFLKIPELKLKFLSHK